MSNKNEIFEYLIDQLRHQVNNNQCEDLAHEVQSLKNQLRDASAQIKELHLALAQATGDVEAYKLIRKGKFAHEQSGRRKEDTQGWPYSFYYVVTDGSEAYRPIREQEQSGCRKEDARECFHNWRFVNGKAPAVCVNCGVTKSSECEHEWQFYGVGFPCMCIKCGLKK